MFFECQFFGGEVPPADTGGMVRATMIKKRWQEVPSACSGRNGEVALSNEKGLESGGAAA